MVRSKSGYSSSTLAFARLAALKGARDSGGKAEIYHTVPCFWHRGKGFLKHGRVDVVGFHIAAGIVQYIVKFPEWMVWPSR